MRYISILLGIIIVIITVAFSLDNNTTGAQGVSSTCNQSGILLRADGTVVIDTWKDFSARMVPSPMQGPQSVATAVQANDLPLAITLGKSLNGTVNICIEDKNGSHCQTLENFRGKVK